MGRNRKCDLENSGSQFFEGLVPSVKCAQQRSQSAIAKPTNASKDLKKGTKSKDATQAQQKASTPKVVPHARSRKSPRELFAAAQAKVSLLQAAISALGDADTVEKEHLQRALVLAQTQEGFIEREKKRLAAAEGAVKVVLQNRDELVGPAEATPTSVPAELSAWMAGGYAGSTHDRRPQSGHRIEFVADEGSRAYGRDDSSGHLRRRIPVSCGSQRGSVHPLLREKRTSRCLARFGLRGDWVDEASHPEPQVSRC